MSAVFKRDMVKNWNDTLRLNRKKFTAYLYPPLWLMYRLPFEFTDSAKLLHFTILGGSADPPCPPKWRHCISPLTTFRSHVTVYIHRRRRRHRSSGCNTNRRLPGRSKARAEPSHSHVGAGHAVGKWKSIGEQREHWHRINPRTASSYVTHVSMTTASSRDEASTP